MADELEKTCENCKYEYEDMEGTHCRHYIHNAEEHFEPKEVELSEKEIRAKAIDEFAEMLKEKYEEHILDLCLRQNDYYSYANSCIQLENYIDKIAEQMKAGGKSGLEQSK